MASNVVMFGWNRPVPGREKISGQHFGEFVNYLGALERNGVIQSFDTVFLDSLVGFVPPTLTAEQAESHTWRPDAKTWEEIKKHSQRGAAMVLTGQRHFKH